MTILNRHERRKKIAIARRLEKKQAKQQQHNNNNNNNNGSHHVEGAKLQWELLKAAEAEIAAERNEWRSD